MEKILPQDVTESANIKHNSDREEQIKVYLDYALSSLGYEEQEVISSLFGIERPPVSNKELARKMHISSERVGELCDGALRSLRQCRMQLH